MKRLCAAAAVAFAAVVFSACSSSCPPCNADDDIAAVVNGEPITMAEVNAAARGRLVRIDTEIYQTKKQVLEGLVEDRLLADAARKKGLSVQQYLDAELGSKAKIPSEEEVKKLYDARKGAIDKPFEEVKDQIAGYLMQNRMARARAKLLSTLRESGDIRIAFSPTRTPIDVGDAPSLGDADAKVTIVEFSDYQCPECRRVRKALSKLLDAYGHKVRYVFMDYPLSFHRKARKAHEAAHCAGDQGRYFEYGRKLFEHQSGLTPEELKKYARQLGLDGARFDACLDAGEQSSRVAAMIDKGSQAGIVSTPAFFINGIMISGARPYESFQEIIDRELER